MTKRERKENYNKMKGENLCIQNQNGETKNGRIS